MNSPINTQFNAQPNMVVLNQEDVALCEQVACQGVDIDFRDPQTCELIHRIMLAISLGAKKPKTPLFITSQADLTVMTIHPAVPLPSCTAEDKNNLKDKTKNKNKNG